MLSRIVSAGAFALTLGFLAAPASAAPLGSVDGVKAGTGVSAAEQVAYRRCWWLDGRRHCRWVEGYGYGPSVGVYIGDGRRGHRHRRHHHD